MPEILRSTYTLLGKDRTGEGYKSKEKAGNKDRKSNAAFTPRRDRQKQDRRSSTFIKRESRPSTSIDGTNRDYSRPSYRTYQREKEQTTEIDRTERYQSTSKGEALRYSEFPGYSGGYRLRPRVKGPDKYGGSPGQVRDRDRTGPDKSSTTPSTSSHPPTHPPATTRNIQKIKKTENQNPEEEENQDE
ncbi:Hypothetical predicted protein [Pelobates cultripes]|uniref:Uncharacterized protein n=1 Tax=Pelobates cultripes TaxID=61616 RepID=A0AAD1S875_PELCU|nr:Hypothetical predicted protein [Pelobates cultripes]